MLIFGIVTMSLIFLASYGGMVSLAQTALFGIAGFVFGNLTTVDTKGLKLGYSPWVGIIPAILIATAVGLVWGGLASRSTGIYFLMITLTYSVIANLTFGQIEDISGFGGISGIVPPSIIGIDRRSTRTASTTSSLVVALLLYLLVRYLIRTPFGISLQGVRDEPVRMSSLGYSVPLHRALAFTLGAFIAARRGRAVRVVERPRRPADDRSRRDDQRAHHGRHRRSAAHRGRIRRARSRTSSSTTAWPKPTSRSPASSWARSTR